MSKFTVVKDSIIPWKTPTGGIGTRRLTAGSSISGDANELKVYVDLHILRPHFEPVATNVRAGKPSVQTPAPAKADDGMPDNPVVVEEDEEPIVPEPDAEPEEPEQTLPQTLADLKAMNKDTLVMLSKQLGLDAGGSKGDLIKRLAKQLFE